MINKITFILLSLAITSYSYGKPRIVVSTTPVASIVSMLTGHEADVVTIDTAASCPHHYHARPSDKKKIQDADMVIYIDNDFDNYMPKMLENYLGIKFRSGDIAEIKAAGPDEIVNWHFWLDLDKVYIFQIALAKKINTSFPKLAPAISKNLLESQRKIAELAELKKATMNDLQDIILLTDSLEHFFNNEKIKVTKLYQKENTSLKYLNNLTDLINKGVHTCLVIDQSQNSEFYKKFNQTVIVLDGENWSIDDKTIKDNLFFIKYLELIHKLQGCKKSL
jgi:zinc transport system substrate-binding protein